MEIEGKKKFFFTQFSSRLIKHSPCLSSALPCNRNKCACTSVYMNIYFSWNLPSFVLLYCVTPTSTDMRVNGSLRYKRLLWGESLTLAHPPPGDIVYSSGKSGFLSLSVYIFSSRICHKDIRLINLSYTAYLKSSRIFHCKPAGNKIYFK